MPDFIILTPSGGTTSVTAGSQTIGSTYLSNQLIEQVVGLVPLDYCDAEDCREETEDVCYLNPVFGNVVNSTPVDEPTYENDINSFLISFPTSTSTSTPSVNFILQKAADFYTGDTTWSDVAVLNDSTYGEYFPLQSIPDHDFYTAYDVNWGKVWFYLGAGVYRVKANIIKYSKNVVIVGGVPVVVKQEDEVACMVSKLFELNFWDCEKADGTVKFETSLTGSVGSIDEYYKVFNLCGFEWYDSLRVRGFFGEETTPKYEEMNLEHQNGQIDQIHNKALNRFKFHSYFLPKFVHDRLKAYMMMADTILVSDYNYNNSDYNIKRKGIRPAGGYEPKYLDKKFFTADNRWKQRRSDVNVEFRESVESVIKSLCCPCES